MGNGNKRNHQQPSPQNRWQNWLHAYKSALVLMKILQTYHLLSKKTYTRAYFDAKTPTGRPKRLAWLMERVERNLPPM